MFKALPVTHRGVRFRSRVEARWAEIFETLGIKWLYEHEGYELPSGCYLPDFWLPELRGFAEVKGALIQFDEKAHRKAVELADASGTAVIVLAKIDPDDWFVPCTNGALCDLVHSWLKGQIWLEDERPTPEQQAYTDRDIDIWRYACEKALMMRLR